MSNVNVFGSSYLDKFSKLLFSGLAEYRPVIRNMSSGLTSEAQLRYLLQWFEEFSELQRDDFLPLLAAARSGQPDQLENALAALSCQDKPMSLFQCRIKLFNEWFPTWEDELQERFLKGVTDIDIEFGKNLEELIKKGPKTNGDMNGFIEEHLLVEAEKNEPEVEQSNEDANPPEEIIENLNAQQDNMPREIVAAS